MLNASRGDVDTSSPWNKVIGWNVVTAFHSAARVFNTGPMRYVWLQYLPTKRSDSPFFENFRQQLLQSLGQAKILVARSENLEAPSKMFFVPERFLDDHGVPITLNDKNKGQYISGNYKLTLLESLKVLGVKEMTDQDFIEHLGAMLRDNIRVLKMKQKTGWNSALARILLLAPKETLTQCSAFTIIPLRDGRWVDATQGNIFFPANDDSVAIPDGIDVMVVHPDAANDARQHALFTLLGVRNFSTDEISKVIVETHNNPKANPSCFTPAQLISHVRFLFQANWTNETYNDIWFATTNRLRVKGSSIYLQDKNPYSASNFLLDHRSNFHFADRRYLSDFQEDPSQEKWISWLCNELHVAVYPRLIRKISPVEHVIHDDFKYIVRKFRSFSYLNLLKDRWSTYVPCFDCRDPEGDPKLKRSREKVHSFLKELVVQCYGSRQRLKDTFLPIPDLVQESRGCVPFLKIPDADDDRWQRFRIFDVGFTKDLKLYLCSLKNAKNFDVTKDHISYLFEQIQARAGEDIEAVRQVLIRPKSSQSGAPELICPSETFNRKEIVYIPSSDESAQGRWKQLNNCVWRGPEFLKSYVALKNIYPDNRRLFSGALKLRDMGMEHLIEDAKALCKNDALEYIGKVFFHMEQFLQDGATPDDLSALRDSKIFPIALTRQIGEYDELEGQASSRDWFIADRQHLATSFMGVVPLLAFTVDEIRQMEKVLRAFGLERKLLSQVVKSVARTGGPVELNQKYTTTIRKKADFVLR
jgi:hypothetical protein